MTIFVICVGSSLLSKATDVTILIILYSLNLILQTAGTSAACTKLLYDSPNTMYIKLQIPSTSAVCRNLPYGYNNTVFIKFNFADSRHIGTMYKASI